MLAKVLAVLICVGFFWLICAICGSSGPDPEFRSVVSTPIELQNVVDCGERGLAEVPVADREHNYAGGSCVHAAMETVLRQQGQDEIAAWWRRHYQGGETITGLAAKAESFGLRFAYTNTGSADFLSWCDRTHRAAVIWYKPAHAITFAGYRGGQAVLIDDNHPAAEELVPKAAFLAKWRSFGGVALTIVYQPIPPAPKAARN